MPLKLTEVGERGTVESGFHTPGGRGAGERGAGVRTCSEDFALMCSLAQLLDSVSVEGTEV